MNNLECIKNYRETILNVILFEDGKIRPQRTTEKYLNKFLKTEYYFFKNLLPFCNTIRQLMYCIRDEIYNVPKCKMCKKDLEISDYGFATYCSPRCINDDPEYKLKMAKSVSVAQNNKTEEQKNIIKEKRKCTIKEKYGINSYSPFGVGDVYKKAQDTVLKRYGVTNAYQLKEVKDKSIQSIREISINKYKDLGFDVTYKDSHIVEVHNDCKLHNVYEMEIQHFNNRVLKGRNGIVCSECNPIGHYSSGENEISSWLDSINIKHTRNNRKILGGGYELDIVIEESKLCIEFNGIYWHSEKYKDKNYHLNKSKLANENGYDLIHIWENDWYDNKDKVKDIISRRLGVIDKRIYARKCKIKEISSKEYAEFNTDNHLQNSINTKYRYGLFYNGELVFVMGFGQARISLGSKSKSGEYELYRMCNKIGISVIGGAGKLLNHFIKSVNPIKIISYSKLDYFKGDSYEKIGFYKDKETGPGYSYLINGELHNRYKLRKDVLVKLGYDSNLTESQIAKSEGWLKVWNCGNVKWKLDI